MAEFRTEQKGVGLRFGTILAIILSFAASLYSQQRVDPSQMYQRIYAIGPMTGKGTWADPKRPLLAPLASEMKSGDRTGILAFHHQVSDDGAFALVEIVGASPAAMAPFVAKLKGQALQAPGLQLFEPGANQKGEIESAFRSKKKDFSFDRFRIAVP